MPRSAGQSVIRRDSRPRVNPGAELRIAANVTRGSRAYPAKAIRCSRATHPCKHGYPYRRATPPPASRVTRRSAEPTPCQRAPGYPDPGQASVTPSRRATRLCQCAQGDPAHVLWCLSQTCRSAPPVQCNRPSFPGECTLRSGPSAGRGPAANGPSCLIPGRGWLRAVLAIFVSWCYAGGCCSSSNHSQVGLDLASAHDPQAPPPSPSLPPDRKGSASRSSSRAATA